MANITYEIQLTGLVNGITAKPREIAWVQQTDTCLDSPCTYNPVTNTITVTLLENCTGTACIEGWVIFGDECTNCEPQHFKRCFCTDKTQCGDCEDCNSLGVCQSLCAVDEFCVNDDCVQCDEVHPCTGGRICLYGNCVCPQGTHWNGIKCVECDETTVLSACEKCENGVIVPVICDGGCDPIKGCVDCVNDTDCASRTDGKHCCNGNNECTCCPGFIWDPLSKKCIIDPCPPEGAAPCKRCTDDGWVSVICPENYICDPELDDCVYSPCGNKPCDNAFDCTGLNCGCPDTTKTCTDCDEDPTGRGCEPNNCANVTCSSDECGEGCGCYLGGCIPCSWLTPEEQAITPGCNNKTCKDTFKVEVKGCTLESTLVTDQPCACPLLMGSLSNGLSTSTILYQNPGSTTPTPNLQRNGYVYSVQLRSNFKYQLRKGLATTFAGFNQLPLLSDTSNINIAHNEKPSSGIYTLEIIGTYKTETSIGVLGTATTSTLASINSTIANLSEVSFNNVILKTVELAQAPVSGTYRGLYTFLTNVKIVVKYSNLTFPNACNYGTKTIAELNFSASSLNPDDNTFNSIYNTSLSLDKYQTEGTRNPLFIYKRSKTSNFTNNDIFRKVYVPKSNGVHKDVLYGPGCVTDNGKFPLVDPEFGLYSGYNYLVTNDCGCGSAKQKSIEPFIVCEDITPSVLLANCNTELTIGPINPNCSVNKNLATLLSPTCSYPLDAQVYFNVYINGTFIKALLPNELSNYVKTVPEGITSIKITHSHDETCVIFEQTYEVVQKEITYSLDCKTGNYSDIVFPMVVSPGVTINKIVNLGNFNEYAPISGVVRIINVLKGSTVNLQLEFSDGCIQTLSVNVDCCDAILINTSTNNNGKICNSVPVTVTMNVTNALGSLTYYINDQLIVGNTSTNTFTATQIGTYTIKIVDAAGCEKTTSINTGECTDLVVTNNPSIICTGQNSTLRLEGDPSAVVVLQYPDLSTTTTTLDVNGVWEQVVSANGDYEVLSYNGVLMNSVSSTLTVVGTPSLSSITAVSTACEDTPVAFVFTGTAGALITVNFGFGSPVNLTIGGGGTVTHNITYPNPGAFTVDVTSISINGRCSVDPGVTHAITISQKPTILIGNTTCDLLAETASTAVTVSPTSATLSVISGTATISGASGNFFVNSGVSETVVVRANNAGCLTEATIIVNCNCPAIIAPVPDPGVVCASYDSLSTSYIYTITQEPEVVTVYNSTFNAYATYNGNDYPMLYAGGSATLSTLPLDYDLNNPDILITIEDTLTGCTDSITITPIINIAPIVNISGPTTLCVGVENTFNSNTTGSAIGYTYTWHVIKDSTPLTVTGNTNPIFKYTPSGVGSVFEIYLVMQKDGCETTSNSLVYTGQTCCSTLSISTSGNTINSCSDITLSSTGTAPFSWSWVPTGTLLETQTSLVNNIIDANDEAPGASGTYQISVTDANGCTGSLTLPYSRSSITSVSIPFNSLYGYNSAVAVVLTYIKIKTCANVDHILWSAGTSYPDEECVIKNTTTCSDADLISNTYVSGILVDIPTMISHLNTALSLVVSGSTFSYNSGTHSLVLTSDCDNIKQVTINASSFLGVSGTCQLLNPQSGGFPSASFNC